jgi:tetratricopeptide (TPR) repeat protein
LTFVCIFSYSQVNTLNILPFKDGGIFYSGTLQVDNTVQKELNIRAKRWFVLNFGDIPKAAITYEEPEGGMLIGKAGVAVYEKTKVLGGFSRSVWFTIQFTITDNKCIYEFQKFLVLATDKSQYFPLERLGNFSSSATQNEYDFLVGIDTKIKTLIQSIEKAIDPNRSIAISSYLQKFDSYNQKGDTLSALKTIKDAYDKYPEDLSILIPLLYFYLSNTKSKEITNYFGNTITVASEKSNYSSYYLKGFSLQNEGKEDDAIMAYKVAIQVKSDEGMPYFYIGYIHYGRAVKLKASNENPIDELLKVQTYWEEAIKYLPNDKNIKNNIKTLKDDIEKEKQVINKKNKP